MRSLLTALPGLGCAVMMAGMMLLMWRGTRTDQRPRDPRRDSAGNDTELADLRTEIDRLRAELRASDQTPPAADRASGGAAAADGEPGEPAPADREPDQAS
jgi:hypothetical protein